MPHVVNTVSISRIALKVAPFGLKKCTACQNLSLTQRLGKRAIYGWALTKALQIVMKRFKNLKPVYGLLTG
jgi:hypothetical protein